MDGRGGSMSKRQTDRMSDLSFRMMTLVFNLIDLVSPRVDRRVGKFGIQPGVTLVDYGCGPGRYTVRFARLVGPEGKVYAVDVQELAIQAVTHKMQQEGLTNIVPVLAHGYNSGLPEHVADVACALDMFFGVKEPTTLLGELKRITRPDGMLIIDDGHQPRQATRDKILASGYWRIEEETDDHLKCRPV
jgi:ubiquinone/menaquinone biosynthesis C-methylase UbiE